MLEVTVVKIFIIQSWSQKSLLQNVLILELLSFMFTENDIETTVIKHINNMKRDVC